MGVVLKSMLLAFTSKCVSAMNGGGLMKKILLSGLLLLLQLQLFALLTHIVVPVFSMGTRLVIANAEISDFVCGILLFLVELLCVLILFRNSKIDDRKIDVKGALLPFSVALPIQLLIGIAFLFFPYSAGAGITTIGQVWGAKLGAQSHDDIPLYIFVTVFSMKAVLMPLVAYLGYVMGKRKNERERADLLQNSEDNK